MIFSDLELIGVVIIQPEPFNDERGLFVRTFCREEFKKHGLNLHIAQCSFSFNQSKGTLRGMHYQTSPHAEAKLVACTHGRIYDVIIDLRKNSGTYRRWFGVELNAQNHRMLYIPEGFAHGFQTLEDNTVVAYQISEFYHPESARGIRWNDPAFGISWPISAAVISDKDRSYELFQDRENCNE